MNMSDVKSITTVSGTVRPNFSNPLLPKDAVDYNNAVRVEVIDDMFVQGDLLLGHVLNHMPPDIRVERYLEHDPKLNENFYQLMHRLGVELTSKFVKVRNHPYSYMTIGIFSDVGFAAKMIENCKACIQYDDEFDYTALKDFIRKEAKVTFINSVRDALNAHNISTDRPLFTLFPDAIRNLRDGVGDIEVCVDMSQLRLTRAITVCGDIDSSVFMALDYVSHICECMLVKLANETRDLASNVATEAPNFSIRYDHFDELAEQIVSISADSGWIVNAKSGAKEYLAKLFTEYLKAKGLEIVWSYRNIFKSNDIWTPGVQKLMDEQQQ